MANYFGQYAFTYQGKRYATMQFPIEEKESRRFRLPIDASDIALAVLREGSNAMSYPVSGEEQYKLAPEDFPDGRPDGFGNYVLSQKGEREVEEITGVKWPAAASLIAPLVEQITISDYDDSDEALGRQRIAQLERLAKRELDLSDV